MSGAVDPEASQSVLPKPPPAAPPGARGAGGALPARELFTVGLLIVLLAVLLPAWAMSGAVGTLQVNERQEVAGTDYSRDLLKAMLTPWLLPALGLVWVLACGRVDLSVWAVFGLGAVVAARIAGGGASPMLMLAGVTGAGLAAGAVNGAAHWRGLPSWGATLATGTIAVSVAAAAAAGEVLPLEASAATDSPAAGRPVLMVGSLYVAAALAVLLLLARAPRAGAGGRRAAATRALAASSLLAALGGMCWLLRFGWTPRCGQLVGDLRMVAAAVLTGAAVFRGLARALLAALLLPAAMLAATAFQQRVSVMPLWPAWTSGLLLAGMVLAAQWVLPSRTGPRAGLRLLLGLLAGAGVCVLAASAYDLPRASRLALKLMGGVMFLAGAGTAAADRLARRTPAPPLITGPGGATGPASPRSP